MKKECKFCHKTFESTYKPQKYCGKPCYYKSKFRDKKPCSIEDCVYNKPAKAFGLCETHYEIRSNHGDPNFPIRRRRGMGSFNEGYKIIKVNKKRLREHRHFMEQFIGRKLKCSEVVHHKNGNRSDNRLDNLEVIKRGKHTSHHNLERWKESGAESFGR